MVKNDTDSELDNFGDKYLCEGKKKANVLNK